MYIRPSQAFVGSECEPLREVHGEQVGRATETENKRGGEKGEPKDAGDWGPLRFLALDFWFNKTCLARTRYF